MSRIEDAETFGKNLKMLIEKSGKEQKDVAIALDLPPTTFNTWCVGKVLPPIIRLRKVADYFGCNMSDLVEPLTEERFIEIELNNIIKTFDDHQRSRLLEYAKMLKQYKDE